MPRRTTSTAAAFLGAAACLPSVASAQLTDFSSPATLDRWMYPFNGSPGTRLAASTFSARRIDGFDDHDAQFIVGFDSSSAFQTGLDPSMYRVTSVVVYASVTGEDRFRFDPTYDNQNTYDSQDGGYPNLVDDLDEGRPIHLWGLGYRDEFGASSWGETTTFGFNPVVPPAQEARTAFGAVFDASGDPIDISNNLTAEFDATPFAIGQADGVQPGELVPTDTEFSFAVDLCDPGTKAYLADGLSLGELRFAISSLHFASGGPDGGTGDPLFPEFYTRENPIAQILGLAPRIEVTAFVGPIGDYNGDGNRNFFDIADYIADFNAREPLADITGDCLFNFFDISAFIAEFNTP